MAVVFRARNLARCADRSGCGEARARESQRWERRLRIRARYGFPLAAIRCEDGVKLAAVLQHVAGSGIDLVAIGGVGDARALECCRDAAIARAHRRIGVFVVEDRRRVTALRERDQLRREIAFEQC